MNPMSTMLRTYRQARRALVFLVLLSSTATCLAADRDRSLQLTLPPACYAVVGTEISIYYDNIVLTKTPAAYRFEVECDLGKAERRRWTVNPGAGDIGDHALTIAVRDADHRQLGRATTILHVVPANAGEGRMIRMLIVGDSLTHATTYANEIARLLSRPGNPRWRMLGTHHPKAAAKGVFHEGYGGWTWQRFATHYEPHPDGTYKRRSSPFVYLGADGKPALDLKRYFNEKCAGQRPDVVLFLLGINDCFSANPADSKAMDERIHAVLANADRLLDAFRQAAPNAKLAVCLTTPPNSRETAFDANYHGKYHRWGWKRIQHRLVQLELQHFASRANENIYVVPTELNLDPVDGYPPNNGVHPNTLGYKQIGASVYAWLKATLAR